MKKEKTIEEFLKENPTAWGIIRFNENSQEKVSVGEFLGRKPTAREMGYLKTFYNI